MKNKFLRRKDIPYIAECTARVLCRPRAASPRRMKKKAEWALSAGGSGRTVRMRKRRWKAMAQAFAATQDWQSRLAEMVRACSALDRSLADTNEALSA